MQVLKTLVGSAPQKSITLGIIYSTYFLILLVASRSTYVGRPQLDSEYVTACVTEGYKSYLSTLLYRNS